MLRWFAIFVLIFVTCYQQSVIEGEQDLRENNVAVQVEEAIARGCNTAPRAPAAERCIYAGLRGVR
jgi:hypothetical protein